MPAPVVVRFRLVDVDDPSDDWPMVVTPFRAYLDGNDYAPRGEAPFAPPRGSQGGDNEASRR